MSEIEFVTSLVQIGLMSGPNALTLLVVYLIWDKLGKLHKNVKVLNHNSTVITRALLKKNILSPDDIKDVNL